MISQKNFLVREGYYLVVKWLCKTSAFKSGFSKRHSFLSHKLLIENHRNFLWPKSRLKIGSEVHILNTWLVSFTVISRLSYYSPVSKTVRMWVTKITTQLLNNVPDNNLSELSNARMEPFAKFCHETAYYYSNVFKIFSHFRSHSINLNQWWIGRH